MKRSQLDLCLVTDVEIFALRVPLAFCNRRLLRANAEETILVVRRIFCNYPGLGDKFSSLLQPIQDASTAPSDGESLPKLTALAPVKDSTVPSQPPVANRGHVVQISDAASSSQKRVASNRSTSGGGKAKRPRHNHLMNPVVSNPTYRFPLD